MYITYTIVDRENRGKRGEWSTLGKEGGRFTDPRHRIDHRPLSAATNPPGW